MPTRFRAERSGGRAVRSERSVRAEPAAAGGYGRVSADPVGYCEVRRHGFYGSSEQTGNIGLLRTSLADPAGYSGGFRRLLRDLPTRFRQTSSSLRDPVSEPSDSTDFSAEALTLLAKLPNVSLQWQLCWRSCRMSRLQWQLCWRSCRMSRLKRQLCQQN